MSEPVPKVTAMQLDVNQLATQIAAAILFLVPGLNATWVIERLSGPTRLKGTERLLRALSWSTLIYLPSGFWLLDLRRRILGEGSVPSWELILGSFLIIFIAPVLLGGIISFLRESERAKAFVWRFTTIDPTPTAWDFAFKRGGPYLVRVQLRDGEWVGGLFGPESFASAYPERQELFLEQAWRLDEEGEFVSPIADSDGLLVHAEAIEIVELMQASMEDGLDE
jgi:Family of unknown function (DUF6338)